MLGFLLISALASTAFFTKPQVALGNLSRWAFLLTFAGVGLRTNLRELTKQGTRPLLVGLIGEVAIAAITLGLVFRRGPDHYHAVGLSRCSTTEAKSATREVCGWRLFIRKGYL